MNAKDKKQYRDSVFQKIYELAHGSVANPVKYDDLEKETGIGKAELLHVVNYFVQKELLRFEKGFVSEVAKATEPGERDKSFLREEPFIHLTADGIDYCENGFNNPATSSTINYQNIFNRENYGSFQQGGSHNNQNNQLTAENSSSPSRVQTTFGGLEEADVKVLKVICEEAIRNGDRANYIHTETIAKHPALEKMSAEELEESLQALTSELFIDPLNHKTHDIQVFQVSLAGFDDYAQVFIENYDSIYNSVISRIVKAGDRNNKDIAAALNQPLMVVNHILDVLQQIDMLTQFKPLNSDAGFEIVTVSPLLKRRLKDK